MRRRIRDNSQYLNRLSRRDDIKDSIKNVLGNIFHWPAGLTVPAVPAIVASTSKIEETPVAVSIGDSSPAFTVPDVPSVAASTSVKGFTEISGVSISIASPCVVTSAGHGIADHEIIKFTTTGALPTGLTAFAYYYCDYINVDTFRITSAIGGANINASGSQSGTQSVWHET